MKISKIEVNFAVPVELTEDEQRGIFRIVQGACKRTETAELVHWAAGVGSKPMFSQTDAMFLNVKADKDAPFDGEPTFDDSIFCIDTCSRERYESEKV